MITSLLGLTIKTMVVKWRRTLFAVLAVSLAVGLLGTVLLMQNQMRKAADEQRFTRYGDVDLWLAVQPTESPSASLPQSSSEFLVPSAQTFSETFLGDLSELSYITAFGRSLEQAWIYAERADAFALEGVMYAGVDDHPLTQSYYGLPLSPGPGEVVLTESLATELQVEELEDVRLPLVSGEASVWRVAAIVSDPLPTSTGGLISREALHAWFHLDTLQKTLGLEGFINRLMVSVTTGLDRVAAMNRLQMDLRTGRAVQITPLDQVDSGEMERSIYIAQFIGSMMGVVFFMISIVLYLGMLYTAWRERMSEMAIVRAVGGSERQLYQMGLLEAMLTGLFGVLTGVLISIGISRFGFGVVSRWFQLEMAPAPVHVWGLVWIAITAWLIIVAVSRIPAWLASTVDPILSLRGLEDHFHNNISRMGWRISLLVIGLIMLIIGATFDPGTSGRESWSAWGGILLTVGIMCCIYAWFPFIARSLARLLERVRGRLSWVVMKEMAHDPKPYAIMVILISLLLTVMSPLMALMAMLTQESLDTVERRYASDMRIYTDTYKGTSRHYLPEEFVSLVEEIPGVQHVIPISALDSGTLSEQDVLRANPEWLAANQQPPHARSTLPNYLRVSILAADRDKLIDFGVSLDPSLGVDEVALVSDYAEILGVSTGDTLHVTFREQEVVVTVGAILSDFSVFARGMPLHTLLVDSRHPILRPYEGTYAELIVRVDFSNIQGIHQALDRLRDRYPQLRWGDRQTEEQEVLNIAHMIRSMLWMTTGLVLLVSMLGMFNAQSASIHAKRREYAVLRAIHLTPIAMVRLVLVQSLWLFGLAAAIGCFTGWLLTGALHHAITDGPIYAGLTIPQHDNFMLLGLLAGYTVLVSLPMAIQLSRMPVPDVMRME